jgi:hypothetical protein
MAKRRVQKSGIPRTLEASLREDIFNQSAAVRFKPEHYAWEHNLLPCESPDAYRRVEWQPFVLDGSRAKYGEDPSWHDNPFVPHGRCRVPTIQEVFGLLIAQAEGRARPEDVRTIHLLSSCTWIGLGCNAVGNTLTLYSNPPAGIEQDANGCPRGIDYSAGRTFTVPDEAFFPPPYVQVGCLPEPLLKFITTRTLGELPEAVRSQAVLINGNQGYAVASFLGVQSDTEGDTSMLFMNDLAGRNKHLYVREK